MNIKNTEATSLLTGSVEKTGSDYSFVFVSIPSGQNREKNSLKECVLSFSNSTMLLKCRVSIRTWL